MDTACRSSASNTDGVRSTLHCEATQGNRIAASRSALQGNRITASRSDDLCQPWASETATPANAAQGASREQPGDGNAGERSPG